MRVLITGAAGFIGSALCRRLVGSGAEQVVGIDNLSLTGRSDAIGALKSRPNFRFARVDVRDDARVRALLADEEIDTIAHLAAETHVDRSIEGPGAFIRINVTGTQHLLDSALAHWLAGPPGLKSGFRFHHVSTDEVFGDIGRNVPPVREDAPYRPSSPYAASKAAADHLVMAYWRTYGLPASISYGPNTYGPWQVPEKLVPRMIVRALRGRSLPVYGDGRHRRGWLHVDDHAAAIETIIRSGEIGGRYNIPGEEERANTDVVEAICEILDRIVPPGSEIRYRDLVAHVPDRPGHDRRYALDATLLKSLGWRPQRCFEDGLVETVEWYCRHQSWWRHLSRPESAVMDGAVPALGEE